MVYRRANGSCPSCGKWRRVEVEDKNAKVARWRCECGAEVEAPLDPTWYVYIYTNGKRYRQAVGPSLRDARALEGKWLAEVREGKFFDVKRRCQTTLGEFAPRFKKWSETHKRSFKRDKLSVDHLLTRFKGVCLDKITPDMVEKYAQDRLLGALSFSKTKKRPTPRAVNIETKCLYRMLNLAVNWGLIAQSPLKGKIRFLKEPEGRVRYLTPEEIVRLLDSCAKHLRPIVRLALATGMRRGEILGLLWSEVSLERGVITLSGERTKTERSRSIPLNQDAREVLKGAEQKRVEKCDLVFHHRRGRAPRAYGSIKTSWKSACKRAGLTNLRFHDLRHCFASALVMRGAPLLAVKELLGHATLAMTARYSHLAPEALQAAVNMASSYIQGAKAGNVVQLNQAPKQGEQNKADRPQTAPDENDPTIIPMRSAN